MRVFFCCCWPADLTGSDRHMHENPWLCLVSSSLYPFLPLYITRLPLCITCLPLCDPIFHSFFPSFFLVLTNKQSLKEKTGQGRKKWKAVFVVKLLFLKFFFLDHLFFQIFGYYLISLLSRLVYCCIHYFIFSPANFVSSGCSLMFPGLVFTWHVCCLWWFFTDVSSSCFHPTSFSSWEVYWCCKWDCSDPGKHEAGNFKSAQSCQIESLLDVHIYSEFVCVCEEEGGELDSHEEASPEEIKSKEMVLG